MIKTYYNHEHYADLTESEDIGNIEREERQRRRMVKEFAKEFYRSQAWRRARAAYIDQRKAMDGGICELCKEEPGTEVHHKIFLTPYNIGDKDITLNPDNFKLVCYGCHQMEHEAARRISLLKAKQQEEKKAMLHKGGYYYDKDGNLQPFKAHIVWGPPGAGKTTYVREHMQPGDVVIDLDVIGRALSMADKTDVPRNVERIALDIRDFLYKQIERRELNAKSAWVVAGLPKYDQRQELAAKLKADLIQINANWQTCFDHMRHDDERKDKALQLAIINKWFKDYEPDSPHQH